MRKPDRTKLLHIAWHCAAVRYAAYRASADPAPVNMAKRDMGRASAIVLDGFQLRSDADVIRYPDRYVDERGAHMWDIMQSILTKLQIDAPTTPNGIAQIVPSNTGEICAM